MENAVDTAYSVIDTTTSPHPARRSQSDAARLAIVAAASGIQVMPISGVPAPADTELAEAVADALRVDGIPSMTVNPPRNARRLYGKARITRQKEDKALAVIRWVMTDTNGAEIDAFNHEEILTVTDPDAPWTSVAPGVFEQLAAAAAARISGSDQIVEAEQPKRHLVCLSPVNGAPGDGNDMLSRAIHFQMKFKKVELVPPETKDPKCIRIGGTVALSPAANNTQKVEIVWNVHDALGEEVGTVDQVNTIPKGALDGKWGAIAGQIAAAAANGILSLVSQARTAPQNP